MKYIIKIKMHSLNHRKMWSAGKSPVKSLRKWMVSCDDVNICRPTTFDQDCDILSDWVMQDLWLVFKCLLRNFSIAFVKQSQYFQLALAQIFMLRVSWFWNNEMDVLFQHTVWMRQQIFMCKYQYINKWSFSPVHFLGCTAEGSVSQKEQCFGHWWVFFWNVQLKKSAEKCLNLKFIIYTVYYNNQI